MRFRWHSYGAVRRGVRKSGILRCGSVRFSNVVNPTVRFGAVFQYRKTYGAVRFGFEEGKSPTVRFGAVVRRG